MDNTPDRQTGPGPEPIVPENSIPREMPAGWHTDSAPAGAPVGEQPSPYEIPAQPGIYQPPQAVYGAGAQSGQPVPQPGEPAPQYEVPAQPVVCHTPQTTYGAGYSSWGSSGQPGYPMSQSGYVSPAAGQPFVPGQIPPAGQFPVPGSFPPAGQVPPPGPFPAGSSGPCGNPYGAWGVSPVPEEIEEPDDPSKLRILVSGRALFLHEYTGLRRVTAGGGRMLVLLFTLLTLLFGWMALSATMQNTAGGVVLATLILVGGSLLFLLIDLLLYTSRFNRRCEAEYATRCYNPRNPEPVSISEFYDDRVVVTTARGSSVVPFSRVTAYVETADQIALLVGREFVSWRGGDLTPFDARLIRDHLRRHVNPPVVRIKHEMIPCLRQPLPIPALDSDDRLVVRARIVSGAEEERRRRIRGLYAQLPELLPMLLVLATATAQYWILSNYFLLDVLAFFAGYLAVALLLSVLLLLPGARSAAEKQGEEAARDLAFTRDGLAVRRCGFTRFVNKERIRVLPAEDGVTLEMPSETLFVPWTAAEDPESLKALFR
jgi:hypothetical protein